MIQQQPAVSVTKASLPATLPFTPFTQSHDTIQMVVFDVYGTILHTRMGEISILEKSNTTVLDIPELALQLDIQKTQQALQHLILEQHTLSKTNNHIDYPEVDIVHIWQTYSQQEPLFAKTLSKEEAMICALRYELSVNPVWAMPHAFHTLLRLQKAGYALGIISNAQFYTPLILETIYPQWHELQFETCTWSYQHRIAKPSLTLYQRFLQQSTYNAKSILYIGNDKSKDIIPAKKAGMCPLLYAGDSSSYRPYSPDLDTIEHTCIVSLDEILTLLHIP